MVCCVTTIKLIGYEKARDLLYKYVSLFLANYNYYFRKIMLSDM